MRAADLTFAILTRNEVARLERTLRSLPAQCGVFILDADSTDGTIAIAERFGARYQIRPWTNFVDARRYLLESITTPWVFMLDADERPDPALIAAILAAPETVDGYVCTRVNWFCGRPVRGGAWSGERVLRLARRSAARIESRGPAAIHESLVIAGPVGELSGALDHDSYPTLQSYRVKFHRYTDIEAAELPPTRPLDIARTATVSAARALWHFIGRAGYRDGWRGVFIAAASAAYPVVVHWKAWRRACA